MTFKLPKFDPITEPSQDKFDFDNGAKRLADILDNVELPNCFGIYGVWGSGKTSLMNLTKKILDTEEKYKNKIATVWFDPWQFEYEKEVPILFPLLAKIQKSLNADEDLNSFIKSSFKYVSSTGVGLASAFTRNILKTDISDLKQDLDTANEIFFSDYEKWVEEVEVFKDEYEKRLKEALKKSKKEKIIIFIDDMDRCLQENAIQLLEVMKNYLSVEDTLFVLGMDRRVIVDHINKKYPSKENFYGQEYLEKIIPCSINIPSNDPLKLIENKLLEFFENNIDKQEISSVVRYLEEFCTNNRRQVYIIFHRYLTALTYINIENLKAELVPMNKDFWSREDSIRIAILRMCILLEKIPTFFEHYNWVNEYYRAITADPKSDTQRLIDKVGDYKYITENGQTRFAPQAPRIDEHVANRIIYHINNDLFSPLV